MAWVGQSAAVCKTARVLCRTAFSPCTDASLVSAHATGSDTAGYAVSAGCRTPAESAMTQSWAADAAVPSTPYRPTTTENLVTTGSSRGPLPFALLRPTRPAHVHAYRPGLQARAFGYWPRSIKFPQLMPLWRYRAAFPWMRPLHMQLYQSHGGFQHLRHAQYCTSTLLEREGLEAFGDDLRAVAARLVELRAHLEHVDAMQQFGGPANNMTLYGRPNWEKEEEIADWQRARDLVVPLTESVERLATHVPLFQLVSFRELQQAVWSVRTFISSELIIRELWSYELPVK
eukprot:TRINITY_DN44731_c0_g1_i1.p1 TRINITY_DN44731_c0_g1~~TRINITY_DN44731_c0_g1_i1.p1  ORF type:complete len:288 (+),score=30.59 TRINITY_DN44731_c0_g1_i1:107-970(+)